MIERELRSCVERTLRSIHYRGEPPSDPVCGRGSNACSACTDGIAAEDIAYHVTRDLLRVIEPRVFPYQVEHAAFALFAYQARDWDIPESGARVEWDHDPELRKFWRGQVVTVLAACGFNTEGIES